MYAAPRLEFMQSICDILCDNNIAIDFRRRQFRDIFLKIILRGIQTLNDQTITEIFTITQTFIRSSKRFL